ncbi:YgfZ/GcvT domain-containing protein [Poriferisphaera sp. WC338]|uniref:CAF17-like 4Fe-4S cluster assembly/insertion protein YgfZ n=1 Tax=Poriferisphaera sp. WC338 TaxID=3425129 RepID=UPI003D8196B2
MSDTNDQNAAPTNPAMTNPLAAKQEQMGGMLMAWGAEGEAIAAVDSFEDYRAEYAAIRQRVGILHMSWRGLIKITGADAADLLHRMITNEVNNLPTGKSNHALLLNTKGRIEADFILMKMPNESGTIYLDAAKFNTEHLITSLDKIVFTEDITFQDQSGDIEHLFITGPGAAALIEQSRDENDSQTDPATLEPWDCGSVLICGSACHLMRRDEAGSLGLHLYVPRDNINAIYDHLLSQAGWSSNHEIDANWAEQRRKGLRGRPIGWGAYNTARIEAGTPLFMIDYGADSLPAETGILDELVSFTKGCYLGQEIVSRMYNLGHPKRVLVGLKFDQEFVADAGNPIYQEAKETDTEPVVIGGVTSSTVSPLRGNQSIAFGVIKWGKHRNGMAGMVRTENEMSKATFGPLCFM